MAKKKTRRNPPDSTTRNVRASRARDAALLRRLRLLEQRVLWLEGVVMSMASARAGRR